MTKWILWNLNRFLFGINCNILGVHNYGHFLCFRSEFKDIKGPSILNGKKWWWSLIGNQKVPLLSHYSNVMYTEDLNRKYWIERYQIESESSVMVHQKKHPKSHSKTQYSIFIWKTMWNWLKNISTQIQHWSQSRLQKIQYSKLISFHFVLVQMRSGIRRAREIELLSSQFIDYEWISLGVSIQSFNMKWNVNKTQIKHWLGMGIPFFRANILSVY